MAGSGFGGGALDLSGLASKPKQQNGSAVLQIAEADLAKYLPISDRLPVVLELTSVGSAPEAEKQQSAQLAALVESAGGRLLLLRIALEASSPLISALQLEQLPALLVLMRQQPVPLAVGVASGQELAMLLNQVLQLAAREGLTASYPLDSNSEPAEGEMPGPSAGEATSAPQSGHHGDAYRALLSEDYEAAAAHYRAALRENPNDIEAQAGLAQVALVQRSLTVSESDLAGEPANLSDALARADALYLGGEIAAAFNLLLHWFAQSAGEEREAIRSRLLELFLMAGEDPAVTEARRRLSLLLF